MEVIRGTISPLDISEPNLKVTDWVDTNAIPSARLKLTNFKDKDQHFGFMNHYLLYFQSKKLRQQWAKTSQTLSVQAQEMRRVVKRQLSGLDNGSNGSVFLALKTKVDWIYYHLNLK